MRYVTLEVPGMAVAVGGLAERHDPGFAWAQMLRDPLDDAVLACRIATLEENEDLKIVLDQMPL